MFLWRFAHYIYLRTCHLFVKSTNLPFFVHPKKKDATVDIPMDRILRPDSVHSIRVFVQESLAAPLMLMYFVMLFLNTLLRDTKDTMLVTSQAGVEAIPILKSWVVIPCSVIFFFVYSHLASRLTRRGLFRIIIFAFVVFYILFSVLLYPFKHLLTPKTTLQHVKPHIAENFHPVLALIEEWPLGLFYVVSELWASAVCQLMFWQVANDVMSIKQAKSIYPIIGAMGNFGMVVAGRILQVFADQRDMVATNAYLRIDSKKQQRLQERGGEPLAANTENILSAISGEGDYPSSWLITPQDEGWMGTLSMMSILLVGSTTIILYCYNTVYHRKRQHQMYEMVDIDQRADMQPTSPDNNNRGAETKTHGKQGGGNSNKKPTIRESLNTLRESVPLRCAAVLVASYGIAISLVEVTWKGQVKHTFEKPNDYSRFMGSFWTWTGLVSMCFMLLGRAILQRMGYKAAVLFTPAVVAVAGCLFYTTAMFQKHDSQTNAIVAAYAGGIAVLLAKAAKYAFFDATKEIIFIPLDRESQVVGKAAIDVVAYRLSKSGGSLILQVIIFGFGSLMNVTGLLIIATLFGVIVVVWLYTAVLAGTLMNTVGGVLPTSTPTSTTNRSPRGTQQEGIQLTPKSAIFNESDSGCSTTSASTVDSCSLSFRPTNQGSSL